MDTLPANYLEDPLTYCPHGIDARECPTCAPAEYETGPDWREWRQMQDHAAELEEMRDEAASQ
jgi:hypothetical protein